MFSMGGIFRDTGFSNRYDLVDVWILDFHEFQDTGRNSSFLIALCSVEKLILLNSSSLNTAC